jgi:hypothetical protein
MHEQMRADEIFHEFEDELQPIKTRDAMNRKLAKKAAAGWGELQSISTLPTCSIKSWRVARLLTTA